MGDVAAPAARDEDLRAKLAGAIEGHDAQAINASAARSDRGHQARRPRSDNRDVDCLVHTRG